MRVLMTADAVGGVWTYALELAAGLRERNVGVVLATMGGAPSDEQRREARAAGVEQLYASELALEWMPGRWAELEEAGGWLLGLRDVVRPEIVHLNGYVHATLPWQAPVLIAGHSCVLSWFEAVRRAEPPPEWKRYAEAVERGLQAADLVVAPTRAMLDTLRRHYRFDTDRLVVYNGRVPLASREKEPLVLAVGRAWDDAKNVAALEHVAPRLPWEVRVVGAGSRDGILARPALDGLFGQASIFCLPARYEPFGLAALEAASAGCALVLGDIPTLREVWEDAAAFVPPDDEEALEHELRRLIDDPPARADLARRARVRARRYSRDSMVDGYLAAYERLGARELEPVG